MRIRLVGQPRAQISRCVPQPLRDAAVLILERRRAGLRVGALRVDARARCGEQMDRRVEPHSAARPTRVQHRAGEALFFRALARVPPRRCQPSQSGDVLGRHSARLAVEGMKFFDMFSLNCYRESLPHDISAKIASELRIPVMVSEYHFGALDAGLPASGIGHLKTRQTVPKHIATTSRMPPRTLIASAPTGSRYTMNPRSAALTAKTTTSVFSMCATSRIAT